MKIDYEPGLTFDDVLIKPRYSVINSRADTDVSTFFCGFDLKIPIIASPMDTVSEVRMAKAMSDLGGLAILHRFVGKDTQAGWAQELDGYNYGAAVGVSEDDQDRVDKLVNAGCKLICVDVANGHTVYCVKMVKWLRERYKNNVWIMAGNVATAEGWQMLYGVGADSVRVGIGGGSYCSTRTTTGIGLPQLQAIIDVSTHSDGIGIVADGGIRSSADFAKAIAAGASVAMLGGLLVGTDESPGDVLYDADGKPYKLGRGMASLSAQKDRYKGEDKDLTNVVPEGIQSPAPYRGPLQKVLNELVGGLRSAMTYVNAKNLIQFNANTEFKVITNAGLRESYPHIVHY